MELEIMHYVWHEWIMYNMSALCITSMGSHNIDALHLPVLKKNYACYTHSNQTDTSHKKKILEKIKIRVWFPLFYYV